MRSEDEKSRIIARFSEAKLYEQILTDSDIQELVTYYRNTREKIHKNTGPVTVNIDIAFILNSPLRKIWDAVNDDFHGVEFLSGFFFEVSKPHIIHNDDSFELPDIYKGITVPLEIVREDGSCGYPKLCFFDQVYLDGPSKFMKGSENVPSFYNQILYDYQGVIGMVDEPFPESIRERLMPHIRPSNFQGLSFKEEFDSIPGNSLVFDAVRLHAASDFRKNKIKSKLGISIFTTKR